MHNYKELKVWQKGRILVKDVYLISASYPPSELYGITSQIRRATISISNNIAEGSGRSSKEDFSHFLETAFSSALEVENLIFLSFDLSYISNETQNTMLEK